MMACRNICTSLIWMWLINNDVDAGKLRKIYFFNTGILGSAHSVSFACICGAVHAVQHSEHESFSLLLSGVLTLPLQGFFCHWSLSFSGLSLFVCMLRGYIVLLVRVPNCLESTSSVVFQLLNLFCHHMELAHDTLTCHACTAETPAKKCESAWM